MITGWIEAVSIVTGAPRPDPGLRGGLNRRVGGSRLGMRRQHQRAHAHAGVARQAGTRAPGEAGWVSSPLSLPGALRTFQPARQLLPEDHNPPGPETGTWNLITGPP